MSTQKNHGEWTEPYVLAKLLSSGLIQNKDGTTSKIHSIYRNINKQSTIYTYNKNSDIIINNNPTNTINKDTIAALADGLLSDINKIKKSKNGAFNSNSGIILASTLQIPSIKATSKEKADIEISVIDIHTNKEVKKDYSVKLKSAGRASILNATNQTRFTYKINLPEGITAENKSSIRETIDWIYKNHGNLILQNINSNQYKINLTYIDSRLPEVIAEALRVSYGIKGREIKAIISHMAENNGYDKTWLTIKFKDLLSAHATSMNPGDPWNGKIGVTGGILSVDKTGHIINEPIYDLNEFKESLLENCCFDTPSSKSKTKSKAGTIYTKNNIQYIDLLACIRLK